MLGPIQLAAPQGGSRCLKHRLGVLAGLLDVFENVGGRVLRGPKETAHLLGLASQHLGGVEVGLGQLGASLLDLGVRLAVKLTAVRTRRTTRLHMQLLAQLPESAACRRR